MVDQIGLVLEFDLSNAVVNIFTKFYQNWTIYLSLTLFTYLDKIPQKQ